MKGNEWIFLFQISKLENIIHIQHHQGEIKLTIKALYIEALKQSSMKPPDNVPKIPQTIVIPPNIISAFSCKNHN